MEQRVLGKTGLSVSALGYGCGNVGGLMVRGTHEEQVAAVRRALDAGITYFDTAPAYGSGASEENTGRVLSELGAWGRVRLGTKVRVRGEDLRDPHAAVRASIVASLRRLGRDSVDLLQLHNPLRAVTDPVNPGLAPDDLAAAADAMQAVVREGLAAHIGFTGLGETAAVHAAATGGRFESMQAYFNAINPSAGHAGASGGAQDLDGLIGAANEAGLGVIAIRVLAGGAMTAQPQRAALASPTVGGALVAGNPYDADLDRAADREGLTRELGLESALELSFRLAIAHPGVSTALVGFSDLGQLEDAIRWAEHGPLSDDQVRRVVAAVRET